MSMESDRNPKKFKRLNKESHNYTNKQPIFLLLPSKTLHFPSLQKLFLTEKRKKRSEEALAFRLNYVILP